MSLLLTDEQLAAGSATLNSGQLTPSQVSDLVSIFRGYLGKLAPNYPIQAALASENDTTSGGWQRCAKLAACLVLFQENQFTPDSGIAATRTEGVNFSADGEVFEIFKYAFGLFWDIPKELWNKYNRLSSNRTSLQGRVVSPASASGGRQAGSPLFGGFGRLGGPRGGY